MSSSFSDVIEKQTTSTFAEVTGCDIDNFVVRKSDFHRSREFIKEYHYSGGCGNAVMTWAIFHENTDEMLGVIAFQTPISENTRKFIFGDRYCNCSDTHMKEYHGWTGEVDDTYKPSCSCSWVDEEHKWKQHVTELHRLAIKPKCPKNTASWLIEKGLKKLKEYKPKYRAVISFADSTEGHDGSIYQATNALYYGTSDRATFYRDQDGRLRNPRQNGHNVTLSDAKERGWTPEKRDSKHRYLYLLPDPYQNEDELIDELNVDLQEYPDSAVDV